MHRHLDPLPFNPTFDDFAYYCTRHLSNLGTEAHLRLLQVYVDDLILAGGNLLDGSLFANILVEVVKAVGHTRWEPLNLTPHRRVNYKIAYLKAFTARVVATGEVTQAQYTIIIRELFGLASLWGITPPELYHIATSKYLRSKTTDTEMPFWSIDVAPIPWLVRQFRQELGNDGQLNLIKYAYLKRTLSQPTSELYPPDAKLAVLRPGYKPVLVKGGLLHMPSHLNDREIIVGHLVDI